MSTLAIRAPRQRWAPSRRPEYRERVPAPEGDDDAALAMAWAAGGNTVMRTVWDRYGTLVHTYCTRSIGDRDLAADCVQETFVSAWRSRERFDPARGSLPGWLLGIARHRVHDLYRAQTRALTPHTVVTHEAERGPVFDTESGNLVERLLLADALATLTPRAREVLELAFYSRLSQSEIAARLDVPLGTVNVWGDRLVLRRPGSGRDGLRH